MKYSFGLHLQAEGVVYIQLYECALAENVTSSFCSDIIGCT